MAWFSWEPGTLESSIFDFPQSHNQQADPKVGTALPPPVLAGKSKPGELTLLIAMGECSECALRRIDPNPLREKFDKVVAVFQGTRNPNLGPEYEKFIASFDAAWFVEPSSFARLNATWVPRGYILGSDGVLESLQRPDEDLGEFVRRSGK
jgi:hypothetical protein